MKNENNDFSEYFKELEEIINGGMFGFFGMGFLNEEHEEKPFQLSDNNNSPNSSTHIKKINRIFKYKNKSYDRKNII